MTHFMAAFHRLRGLAEDLRELADDILSESDNLRVVRDAALEAAALIADQVEASADPGDGKDAADEIGRRIRALMEGTR